MKLIKNIFNLKIGNIQTLIVNSPFQSSFYFSKSGVTDSRKEWMGPQELGALPKSHQAWIKAVSYQMSLILT